MAHCQKAEKAKSNITNNYGKYFMNILNNENIPEFGCNEKVIKNWCDGVSSDHCSIKVQDPSSFDITHEEAGLAKTVNIKFSVFASKDYKNYFDYVEASKKLLKNDAYLTKQDKTIKINNFLNTFEWIIAEAKRGYTIQRYKGLGEMNPEQLWETTMDPKQRTLVQITEEDEAIAEKTFEDLMGDNVAPRKAFIEENAHYAGNIDI